MIRLHKINKIYRSLAGPVHALKDVDLYIPAGESVAIVGKSGSGKSTLLNIISGIDRPDGGELSVAGMDLNALNENELAKWRGKNIGIVFQNFQLLPTLSAVDNVLFPMDLVEVIPVRERKSRAMGLLERVGLADKFRKFPNELSGGEVQRVAIARALANDPPMIVADEPTGNLDSKTGEEIYVLFRAFSSGGRNLIVVTHENVTERNFDRVVSVQDGSIQNSAS